jgi:hypothetical protein
VSVPVWGATLSGPLPVVGLVGRYPTNYLMGRRPLLKRLCKLWFKFSNALNRMRY